MKKIILAFAALAGLAAVSTQAQEVFSVSKTGGVPGDYFGAGFFSIAGNTGQFQIDVLNDPEPTAINPSFSEVQIATPAGSLSFQLGAGTSTAFDGSLGTLFPDPYYFQLSGAGFPLAIMGEIFTGDFASTPAIDADLAAGEGTFTMLTGPTLYAAGPMDFVGPSNVPAPEPGSLALGLCGTIPLLWRIVRNRRR